MLSYVRLPMDERESVAFFEGCPQRATSGTESPAISMARSNGPVLPPANTSLADLTVSIPNLTYTLEGEQQCQLKPLDALHRRLASALIMIFALAITHLRLNASRVSIGARTPLRIQTRGGHA